jgi:hypothetical protein
MLVSSYVRITGGDVTFKVSELLLDKPPLIAENCSVKLPVDAAAGTVKLISCAVPGLIVNGLEGDGVIPAGRPENDTVIGLENPFFAAVDTTDGGLVVPEMAVSADGPTEKVKSGGGGGGGGGVYSRHRNLSRA